MTRVRRFWAGIRTRRTRHEVARAADGRSFYFGVSPCQNYDIPEPEPEPEHWHLSPVDCSRDEDGVFTLSWCQTESPDLGDEWAEYQRYVPRRVSWN